MALSFGINFSYHVSITIYSVCFGYDQYLNNLFTKIGCLFLVMSLCGVVAFAQTPHGDIFTDKGDCPCCGKEEIKRTDSLAEETVAEDIESNDLDSNNYENTDL